MRYWLFCLLVGGCAAPEIDDVAWRCAQANDCGAGFVCDVAQGQCVRADRDGINGVEADAVHLGAVLPLTAGPTTVGQAIRSGLEAAFARVNQSGGVHGRRIVLDVRDGAWDPESALTAVRQLTDQRQTLAIIGGPGGHVAAVLGDQLQQRDVLFFSLAGVSLSAGYGAGGHDQAEADALLDRWGIANAQLTTVIQGTINGRAVDAHGASVQAAFANGSAPGLELIAPVYTLDFDALVRQWLPWAAQQAAEGERTLGVVLGVDAPTAVGFVRTARAALGAVGASAADARRWGLSADDAAALAGIEVRFATLSSTGPTAWSAGLDVPGMPKDCIGLWAAQTHPPVAQGGELVDAFRADLEALDAAAYPSESALRGYLLGRALIEALDAQGAEISAETFKQTLAGLNAFDFLAGEGISAEDRQLFETVYLIETDADCAWQAVP